MKSQEHHENLFVTVPKVTCKTPDKLMGSKAVGAFLEMFNVDMEAGELATPESVSVSFHDFERVREYFERFKVQGKPRDIQTLMHLIDETGARVKKLDTTYKLPEAEVRERFAKLGIDIEKKRKEWSDFYRKQNYKSALVKSGVTGKNEPYTLPMPEICEAEMQAFEEALKTNPGMEIMIDDARLIPSETFNHFQHRPNTKTDAITSVRLVQALPVTPRMAMEYVQEKNKDGVAMEDIDPTSALQELHKRLLEDYNNDLHRGVRLVAYQPKARFAYWGFGQGEDGMAKESERAGKSVEFMEIGTCMRLCKYLEAKGESSLYQFQNYENGREQGYVPLSTTTANISPDGQVFDIEYDERIKRFGIIKIPAGQTPGKYGGGIAREVVQTKI